MLENELTSALNKSNRLVDIPDVCRRPIILVTKYRVLAIVQYVQCCYNRFFLCISYKEGRGAMVIYTAYAACASQEE